MADRKLKIDIRRGKILEHLQQSGKVLVSELSEELSATPVTIRSDLDALQRDGYLVRVQGGAMAVSRAAAMPDCAVRSAERKAGEKRAIAAQCAGLIRSGDTLFINSGTTTQFLAAALSGHRNLNIVTNSTAVAMELGAVATFRVLLLGGEINASYGFTYGGDAQEQLSRYQADWAILSVDGISARGGITTYHAEEAVLDRMMLRSAKQGVILADHSKIGRAGFSRICESQPPIRLITDSQCDPQAIDALRECGLDVTVV